MIYCIGCLVKLVSLLVKTFHAIVGILLGLIYPLVASVRAIESRSQGDDKQWLTYWVIYSLVALIELTFNSVIQWIPIWPFSKLILTSWLVLPGLNGAAHVYDKFVRPCNWVVPPKTEEDNHLPAKYTTVMEKNVSWADTSAKYIGGSAFDHDYPYY